MSPRHLKMGCACWSIASSWPVPGSTRSSTIALGPLLAGVIETDPAAMDEEALHKAAYALARPRFDGDRKAAVERFQALSGSGDARGATGIEGVVRAAYQGRIEVLLLTEDEAVWGSYDEAADEVATGARFKIFSRSNRPSARGSPPEPRSLAPQTPRPRQRLARPPTCREKPSTTIRPIGR